MGRLTATFTVPLSATVLLRGDDRPRRYEVSVEEFDVELAILIDEGARSRSAGERLWTVMSGQIAVSVSREEAVAPPPIATTQAGGRDFSASAPYFGERLPQYQRIASTVLNSAISFLRFQLRQPLSKALADSAQGLANPKWIDHDGKVIDPGGRTFVVPAIAGERGEFGVVKFEHKHDKMFCAALAGSPPPSLHIEILSDAQAAVFDRNIRRAVLELAIACEVFAKHTFFGADGNAAQVFDALEDRGKVGVRVLDLIDIGTTVAGKSFRVHDKQAYADIDHLFRARNKVAHRGDPVFRDDKGALHRVDLVMLAKWWRSVEKLFAWAG